MFCNRRSNLESTTNADNRLFQLASAPQRNAEIVGVSPEDIRKLGIGEFYIRAHRSGSAVKFRTREDLLDWRNSVTAPTWKRMLKNQIEKYYTGEAKKVEEAEKAEEVEFTGDEWTIETE